MKILVALGLSALVLSGCGAAVPVGDEAGNQPDGVHSFEVRNHRGATVLCISLGSSDFSCDWGNPH